MGCLGLFLYILYILFDLNNGQSIYVDAHAVYPFYGTSTRPFKTIQDGIDFAVENRFDTVIVRDGTYTPASTITIPSSENLKYIISENGSSNTIIKQYGFDVKSQTNKQTVTIQGFTMQLYCPRNSNCGSFFGVQIETATTIIDLQINTNGASSAYYTSYGIKTLYYPYDINIINSTIYFQSKSIYSYAIYGARRKNGNQGNFKMKNVSISGGIMYVNNYFNINIDGCSLNDSTKNYDKQINYLGGYNISVSNSIVSNNFGGGLSIEILKNNYHYTTGSIYIHNNIVTNNTSSDENAGGISIKPGVYKELSIANNTITNNHGRIGGGIYIYFSELKNDKCLIRNNIISSNHATKQGGGIRIDATMSSDTDIKCNIINTTIQDNTCDFIGGGLYTIHANVDISKNTKIINNNANAFGSDVYCYKSTFNIIDNSIIQNNTNNDIFCNQYCYFDYKPKSHNIHCKS